MDEWFSRPLEQLFWASTGHFLLGFCVGFVAFSLTSTILLRMRSVFNIQDSSILIISILVSVSLSVAVHILEDYLLMRF